MEKGGRAVTGDTHVEAAEGRRLMAGHVAPFAVWIGVMLLLEAIGSFTIVPRAWYPLSYAAKSAICAGLFLWLRPWRVYPALRMGQLPLALAAGLVVAALWIVPEMPWVGRVAPGFQEFYHRWLIMMPGALPGYFNTDFYPALPPGHLSMAFAPEEAGWGLTLMKLAGSACVIAVVEEFFFRGFFYRWIRKGAFWEVPMGAFDRQAFWTVAAVFALEHDRWLAGLMAGVIYGWLAVRKGGGVWMAAVAHGITNFVLGAYVIMSRQYGFW